MNEKYQIEIDEFTERFQNLKDARIVLYGIGRYTATLLEGIEGFRFVGLMDKEPSNIGKEIFGLPVIDKDTAEKTADLVVINTSETYWNVIYERIRDIKIPVYYKNGQQAEKRKYEELEYPYQNLSYEDLCSKIEDAEVVSFDFFDTLFMRSVCNPRDIFRLLEAKSRERWEAETGYTEIRNKAKEKLSEDYSLDELYLQIEDLSKMPHSIIEAIKERELTLERKLLIPREKVLSALRFAQEKGKEVYIISDMYLPEEFYRDVLGLYAIELPEGHILLSNILHRTKADGSMWEYYSEKIVKNRKALHVGDHQKADIEEPKRCNLEAYRVPCAWDMLTSSSMGEIASYICSDYDSAIMGCVLNKWCNDPFSLGKSNGIVQIRNNEEMGYCVFGPVVLTFLLWLLERSREDHIEKLIFMSRDGYFLKEDFEYLCSLKNERQECCYLGISRQLAMTASIETLQEILEYASMPYSGSIPELFEDRFEIKNIEEIPEGKLEDYIDKYFDEIEKYVLSIRKDYLDYIEQMGLTDQCATVDLGYYGNNQKYLNKLAGLCMPGYYFNANLSEQNQNTATQKMTACFQKKSDLTGEHSQILKRQIYLESVMTAPYGMVKAVDRSGQFRCAEKKKNQEYFQDKVEINQGIKQFICDYLKLFGEFELEPNTEFTDQFYGFCFSGRLQFAEEVKRSFFNDNAMMNRIESMLFY